MNSQRPTRCAPALILASTVFWVSSVGFAAEVALSPGGAAKGEETGLEIKISGAARVDQNQHEGPTLVLEKATGRALVEFSYAVKSLDLSAFRDLAVRVCNKSASELDILITGVSDDGAYNRRAQTRFLVRPSEDMDLRVFMARGPLPKDHPFIKRLGNLFAFPWGFQRHWQHVDAAAILRVTAQVDWVDARPGETLTLSRPFGDGFFSLDPAQLDTLPLPIVDEFGQDRSQTWPGKVMRVKDLRDDAAKDAALVASVTRPKGARDGYGGDTRSPVRTATGFFRVEKVNGKWWFIDPEGHLFWSLGVNGAANSSGTHVKGRENLFPSSARTRVNLNHYEENVKLKHPGAHWRKEHAGATLARLTSWGFNTVGAWSMDELYAARRIPYTLIAHVGYQRIGDNRKIADPYSDEFKNDLERNLAELAVLHADSPWLIGIFIDNELEWKNGTLLAEEVLNSAHHTPARRALVAFIQERYSNIAGLNRAWGCAHGSFNAVRTHEGPDATPAYQQDMRDYLTVFAEAYFSACEAAMEKHFPKHLYLGCRFHIVNPIITAIAARHCDVLSVNAYRYGVAALEFTNSADKPSIITEFHFGTRDSGVWGVGLAWAADARNQSDLVHAYLSDALRHPNIIGAHWFQWSGQAVTGRDDGENFGVGLVSIVDRPEDTLISAFKAVSGALYDYRLGNPTARIGAPARQ